jgi:hypothetical protein
VGLGPVFVGKGTADFESTAADLTPTFPTRVQANDIAIIVHCSDNTSSPSWPGGWAAEAQQTTTNWNTRMAWLRCTGSEGGTTVAVAQSGAVVKVAQIYLFRHCVASGTPYEDYSGATGSSTTAASNATTISGGDRLAVRITCNSDDVTGSTPAGFTSPVADTTLLGGDMSQVLDFKVVTNAGTEASSSRTITSGAWTVLDFAMIPMATPPIYTFNPNDKGAVTLSNSNRTVTHAGGDFTRTAATTRWHHTGKYVLTLNAVTVTSDDFQAFGLTNNACLIEGVGSLIGTTGSNGYAFWDGGDRFFNGSATFDTPAWASSDILIFAWDLDNRRMWLRVNGGNWNSNGSADPATNVGGIDISGINVGALCFAWESDKADTVTLAVTSSPPAGFSDIVVQSRMPSYRRPPYRFFNKGF